VELYFAFGSNLDADQMAERCPGARAAFRARLPDHRIDFTHASQRWGGGAADIVHEPGGTVWGMVWQLEESQLTVLDGFERGYERVELTVLDAADRPHRVLSYRVREKGAHRPTRLYLGKLLRWGERWEFPADYLARLRAIKTCDET
jgi:hypothetical protein